MKRSERGGDDERKDPSDRRAFRTRSRVRCCARGRGAGRHPTGRPGRPDRGRRNASRRRHRPTCSNGRSCARVATSCAPTTGQARVAPAAPRSPLPRPTCSNGRSCARVATSCAPTTEQARVVPAALRSRRRSPRPSRLPWLGRCALRRGRRAWHRPAWRRGRDHAVPAAPPDPPLTRIQSEYANYREINRPKLLDRARMTHSPLHTPDATNGAFAGKF